MNNIALLFFIAFPFVCEYVIGYTFSIPGIEDYLGNYGLVSFITLFQKIILFYTPFILFHKKLKAMIYAYIVIGYLPALINCLHMLILKSVLNPCSIYVILASNINEASEFIEHVCNYQIFALIALFAVAAIIPMKLSKNNIDLRVQNYVVLSLFYIAYLYFTYTGNMCNRIHFVHIVRAIYEYANDQKKYRSVLNINIDYGEVKSRIQSDKNQTYVIIFGESVDKKHMGLYGYYRNTTPYFDEIKNELKVFKNVKSAFGSTLLALNGSLTFNSDIKNGNIISFLNYAKFKTYWLSNQFALGHADSLFGVIAKFTNGKSVFINTCTYFKHRQTNTYDHELIPAIKNALDCNYNNKVIFVHLFGSHFDYNYRYPDTFNYFCKSTMTKRAQNVAQYDNSIRYTDYVLKQILDLLKSKKDEITCMLYLSDHGEDCYDEPESTHMHGESTTRPHVYDIPVIVWASDEYKKLVDIESWDTDKKYTTSDMIHSILDLIGLEGEYIDRKKSLFYNDKAK